MSISVIIPTKGRPTEVIRCINSIMEQTLLPDEIIIVDASRKKGLKSKLESLFRSREIEIFYISAKPGACYQKNIGVDVSRGEILLFLDDDVELNKDFIKEIMKVFDEDEQKEIGGVMGQVMNRSLPGTWGSLFRRLFFLPLYGNGKFRYSGVANLPSRSNRVMDVEFLPAGLTAYKKKIFNEFRFDENLQSQSGYSYCEDEDFSYKVSKKFRNVYAPCAKLYHYPSSKFRDSRCDFGVMVVENRYYIFKKSFPQTVTRKFAFWISILGMLILMLRDKNWGGTLGVIRGTYNVWGKKFQNVRWDKR